MLTNFECPSIGPAPCHNMDKGVPNSQPWDPKVLLGETESSQQASSVLSPNDSTIWILFIGVGELKGPISRL